MQSSVPPTRPGAARAAVALTPALAVLSLVAVAAGCRTDGRVLREARPDQTLSISVPASTAEGSEFALPDLSETTLPASTDTGATDVGAVIAPWRDGAPIDPRNTCDGLDISPALAWEPAPAGTAEIAVSLSDLDAPDFVHWVVAGLPADSTGLGEGELPIGAVAAINGFGDVGYAGPCPPAGDEHRYLITVHYLGEASGLTDGASGDDMLARLRQTAIATAEVTGTFSRAS
ncbi:MAG: YbhB/YbcL family Raf kinase inhibitor-like protein [Ilumatobacteraceae bacterium]